MKEGFDGKWIIMVAERQREGELQGVGLYFLTVYKAAKEGKYQR